MKGLVTAHIAFSKLITREGYDKTKMFVDQQPIISTAINTKQPCFGLEKDAMILGSDGKANLSFELEKEVTVENCSIDDWRKNMFEDRRYVTT